LSAAEKERRFLVMENPPAAKITHRRPISNFKRGSTAAGRGCGGLAKVRKRYLSGATGFSRGRIIRPLLGAAKRKHAQLLAAVLCFLYFAIKLRFRSLRSLLSRPKTIFAGVRERGLALEA
jgi:hypothetical protein